MILNKIPQNIYGLLFQINSDGSRLFLKEVKLKEYLTSYPNYYLDEISENDSENNLTHYYSLTFKETKKMLQVPKQLLNIEWF
jgi:hypothetical protein